MLRTQGTSQKAKLAAIFAALQGVVVVLIVYVVTGELDSLALVAALTALSGAVFAFAGAWLGAPGAVIEDAPSDSLLPPMTHERLARP